VLKDCISLNVLLDAAVKHAAVLDTLPNRYPPLLSTSNLPYPASGAPQLDGGYPGAG